MFIEHSILTSVNVFQLQITFKYSVGFFPEEYSDGQQKHMLKLQQIERCIDSEICSALVRNAK